MVLSLLRILPPVLLLARSLGWQYPLWLLVYRKSLLPPLGYWFASEYLVQDLSNTIDVDELYALFD